MSHISASVGLTLSEANQVVAALERRADTLNTHLAHLVTERIRLYGRTEPTDEEATILGAVRDCIRVSERLRLELEWESRKPALDAAQLRDLPELEGVGR